MSTDPISAYAAREAGGRLEPLEYSPSALGPHDVELEVSHCGLCHSDLHLIDNDWQYSRYPLIPGHEVVGTVLQKGELLPHLEVGERVGVGWQCGSCLHCEWCVGGAENLCSKPTYTCAGRPGGFADRMRVDGRFAFSIPDTLGSQAAAPLLCGGITVHAPLARHATPHSHVGVIGIGGLGHLAVRFARALGCEVTAFSSTPQKEEEALSQGAHHFVSSVDDAALKKQRESLDLILSTVHRPLDWRRFANALRPNGTLCFVGAVADPLTMATGVLVTKQRSITGGSVGGRPEMRAMLEFAARHGISAQVETLPMREVNTALDRLRRNDVRYRFVLEN